MNDLSEMVGCKSKGQKGDGLHMYHTIYPNGHVTIVLLEGFSSLSFGALIEPFSYLERIQPNIAPKLVVTGVNSRDVRSQSGIVVRCDESGDALVDRLKRGLSPSRIVICGPTDKRPSETKQLLKVLRIAQRNGAFVYAIGGVIWLLAECGFLEPGEATVHWSMMSAFSERFKHLDATSELFSSNRNVTCCASETATIDLTLEIVSAISPQAANEIADHLLISYPRAKETVQPGSRANRLRGVPHSLTLAVKEMSENIETVVPIHQIASKCELSSRSLERLFSQHLGSTPQQYYTQIRLDHAHDLITQTDVALLEVALASGFSSTGMLSKHFKRSFGKTPTQMRGTRLGSPPAGDFQRHADDSVFLDAPIRSNG